MKEIKISLLFALIAISFFTNSQAQSNLITNVLNRKTISLNGIWQYIIDPYETGFYDYRREERNVNDREAYWNTEKFDNKTDRKEFGFTDKYAIKVPGDWNSQADKFMYYEGTVWYKKSFDVDLGTSSERIFLHFGAVNYRADVYLNGKKLGMHKGGFTAFNFEIPSKLLQAKGNFLVVKVDNKRSIDEIPTINTDWWNYGGITRDVNLVFVPQDFVQDYSLQLAKGSYANKAKTIEGWLKLNRKGQEKVTLEIPELKIKRELTVIGDSVAFNVKSSTIRLWSPKSPKLYQVIISTKNEKIVDKIGFRNIEIQAGKLILNGKPVFLRGISVHEEIPDQVRRAYSDQDAQHLLGQAKELNANMVRLAHYPHNEYMTRAADSLGIMVWSEIPVYWTIDFKSADVLAKAKTQLEEMITRDRNRASIIIWSVGNETPVNADRTLFMSKLVKKAKEMDQSRIVAAALESFGIQGVQTIEDPLGEFTDVVAVNQYIGWYGGLPDNSRKVSWATKFDKPIFFSETGAEGFSGFHADSLTRYSEEFQEWYYREQVGMFKRMPANFAGLSPWILNDFRSPRRNHPIYQEGWNNKGLFDHNGKKKKAFYVLKAYYDEMEKLYDK
ncbi:beta-glucuronidase [Pedobacter frigiditerrae]|uniref:Beta-glucuronidase n=1 Tax=Pedobacter frigiditerrae TaxID=2530452 RepID=A0A4R0MPL0_9SPHI|nr:glycoside hydrolase family 2 TIM barrel-domain containing protein [Pedobacter frigiditerrae]TCC88765.1 beta-glucuronidase [Pedobacter frigiditerrae]